MSSGPNIDYLEWYNLGLLSNLDLSNIHINSKGVYIWINDVGEKKRIIYVGTANSAKGGFRKRLGEHIGSMSVGNETIYNFADDPYDILTKYLPDIENLPEKEFWYPKVNIFYPIPIWVSRLAMEFMSKIRVWICPLNENQSSKEDSYCIESQLLNMIVTEKKITSWSGRALDSWIGKQSRKMENAQKCPFGFNKDHLPDLYKDDLKYFTVKVK